MDSRLHKINQLLREYSKGNFEKRLEVSQKLDEIDSCIVSINMLGEELKDATISRNYFNNIFNSVSDMVFVLDKKGTIKDINQSVSTQLKYAKHKLIGTSIEELCNDEINSIFKNILKQLSIHNGFVTKTTYFQTCDKIKIPVEITVTWLINERNRRDGILLTAKDVAIKQQTEKLVIRAIIDTEERERQRFARDLHDSLGQQLSGIKFHIGTSAATIKNPKQKLLLKKSNEELIKVQAEMRGICFNLAPKPLREFGLLVAVKELCNQIARGRKIQFIIRHDEIPALPTDMATDIFRIIQEFINNALRHGKANKIKIIFSCNNENINIDLKDNGAGFDLNKANGTGMGLQNVKSRVKSHNGEIKIKSALGKGTEYFFSLPLNAQL